ncbi:Histone promoter control protein Hpc2 [Schizosaccharomyces pombe]
MSLLSGDQRIICLEIPLQGKENVHINFAKEAEKLYGPSVQENSKKNDLSDSADSEGESTHVDEQQAANGAADGTQTIKKKKRKRRYADEYYDRTDPFIDDAELYIEEKAAATKDGFFVFSGPLVAEGDTVKIERSKKTKRKKKTSLSNATHPAPAVSAVVASADASFDDSRDIESEDEQPLRTLSIEMAAKNALKEAKRENAKVPKDVSKKEAKTTKSKEKATKKTSSSVPKQSTGENTKKAVKLETPLTSTPPIPPLSEPKHSPATVNEHISPPSALTNPSTEELKPSTSLPIDQGNASVVSKPTQQVSIVLSQNASLPVDEHQAEPEKSIPTSSIP